MLQLRAEKRESDRHDRYRRYCDQAARPGTLGRAVARLMTAESPVRGLGARLGGADAPLVGITHYLFHAHAWMQREVCYLQDLFVDDTVRRRGCGAKLIEAVAAIARERGCARLYWTTKEDNVTARSLYDRIARFNGFIRYDYALD
jgi:GNAT superfamily N-acetyltransferase